MKRIFYIILALVLAASMLSGCASAKYKKGVDYDGFPYKDVPVYDDAIVFSFEEDDGEWEIEFGTDDNVDDVMDFYQDEFDDDDYVITDEEEDKDEYSVEGYIDEYEFEIEAEEASGELSKYYETVVSISVEENDNRNDDEEDVDASDSEETNADEQKAQEESVSSESQQNTSNNDAAESTQPQGEIDPYLVGIWRMYSTVLDTLELYYWEYGIAVEFLEDGTMHWYNNFKQNMGQDGIWFIGEDGKLYAAYDYWNDGDYCFYGEYEVEGDTLYFHDEIGDEMVADSWYLDRSEDGVFINWYDVEQYMTEGNIFCEWADEGGNELTLYPSNVEGYGYYYADGYGSFGYFEYDSATGNLLLLPTDGEEYLFIYSASTDIIYGEFGGEYTRVE